MDNIYKEDSPNWRHKMRTLLSGLWEDYLKPVLILLLVFGIAFGSFAALNYSIGIPACNSKTVDIGLPHRWLFWGGCQVFEGGKWIPLENWRYLGK